MTETVENNTKLTKDVIRSNVLIFYPQTTDEAATIQRKLFEIAGCAWRHGGSRDNQKPRELSACVQGGIMVYSGWLYSGVDRNARRTGMVCTVQQLDENYVPPLSVAEQSEMAQAFNRLSDRVEELEAQVADAVKPAVKAAAAARAPKAV